MSLHYLVKLEMLVGHVLYHWVVTETPEFMPPQLWPPHSPDLNPLQRVGNSARGAQNTHHWSERTETATENGVGQAGSCRHCNSHSSVASLITSDQWCVFCTLSIAIFSHAIINWIKVGGHSWGGINSEVSFCNNLLVARVQWASQVSEGSVEALFRWGGKRLHHFAANLLSKRCTDFHQNRRVLWEILQRKTCWSRFSGHVVVKDWS